MAEPASAESAAVAPARGPMRIDAITILPPMLEAVRAWGISGRAHERGLWSLHAWNPRDQAEGNYRSIDDRPFGGGPGMVMLAEPLARTLDAVAQAQGDRAPVVYLSPQGRPATHADVLRWAALPALTLLCGRYEGIDQRLIDSRIDEEVAVGDFVVSGGELPAMMLIDAIVRWLPGAMNDADSMLQDSFAQGLLDCPHYTRPEVFEGRPVPPVLLSGHHANIARWRRQRALEATARRRPELIEHARRAGRLAKADEAFLRGLAPVADEPPAAGPARPGPLR